MARILRFAAALAGSLYGIAAQSPPARPAFDSFEVATIKSADGSKGRFIRMRSEHELFAKNYTLKSLIAAAYSVPPIAISGGPPWLDSEYFDISAKTPGEVRPNLDEQMSMMRALLTERFKLKFERQEKTMSIYTLSVAKTGVKLKESASLPDALPELVSTVYPSHLSLPARNATIAQFAAMLQRAVLERPVVDATGLTGRFDFTLEWAADETQFGGQVHSVATPEDPARPSLFAALQEQLGLRLQAGKGPFPIFLILNAERPSEN